MQIADPFGITHEDKFIAQHSDLKYFHNIPRRVESGVIMICQSGNADITIDMRNGHMKRNTQLFILPSAVLMLTNVSENFRVTFLAFSRELFEEAAYRIDIEFFHFMKENPLYDYPPKIARIVNNWLQSTLYIYEDRENIFRNIIIKNRLQNVFLESYDKLQRYIKPKSNSTPSRQIDIFNKFIALIHEYACQEREVQFYADKLCVSTRYLSAITRNVTNSSAKDIIDRLVVVEIKILLQSTDLSIQEIADKLHFPDQSYLGHYFKKQTGESPSAYRNSNKMTVKKTQHN